MEWLLTKDYLRVVLQAADLLFAMPGGSFTLFNDVVTALVLDKLMIAFYDPNLPAVETGLDGRVRIANHAALLVQDHDRLTREIQGWLVQECEQYLGAMVGGEIPPSSPVQSILDEMYRSDLVVRGLALIASFNVEHRPLPTPPW